MHYIHLNLEYANLGNSRSWELGYLGCFLDTGPSRTFSWKNVNPTILYCAFLQSDIQFVNAWLQLSASVGIEPPHLSMGIFLIPLNQLRAAISAVQFYNYYGIILKFQNPHTFEFLLHEKLFVSKQIAAFYELRIYKGTHRFSQFIIKYFSFIYFISISQAQNPWTKRLDKILTKFQS